MSAESKTPDIKEIHKTVKLALSEVDPILIAKAQLEVSMATLQYIQAMDWKLWEMYSKLNKDG